MSRLVRVLAFLPALACGDAVAKPKASPEASASNVERTNARPIATTPVDIVPMKSASSMGALEQPFALRRFFDALARLEAGQAQEDVRITQFGDSHTAADVQTATVRRELQMHFGDGGRGFVAIGRPWKRWLQEGVRVGMSNDWAPEQSKLERGKVTGHGRYGLAGIGLFTRKHGARAWTDVTIKTSRAELAYLEQPRGGAFDVFIDGVRVVRVSTRASDTRPAFRSFEIGESATHQLEIRAVGDGDVRVYGLMLDRAQHGVVLDALGINGARITTVLSWDEQHWAEQLKHRAPSLVVLAYGTNESTDSDISHHTYERQLVDALGRIARAVPSASCLLLGPPDRAIKTKDGWASTPKIAEIIAAQRRVAQAAGCAFYDQLAVMGGDGSIAAWASEESPRAQRDRVHLTREGYVQLGSAFASDLMRAYAVWRREMGLSPSTIRDRVVAPALPDLPPASEDPPPIHPP